MRQKADLVEVLGVPEAAVRVVAEDVGGNFGMRNSFLSGIRPRRVAARRLGRPVKWTCERRETFPAAAVRGRTVLSNTSPLSAYRSAGHPR